MRSGDAGRTTTFTRYTVLGRTIFEAVATKVLEE
jgi:hypothetical protein